MNRVILIGNLTKDPEVSQVQAGSGDFTNCRFTIAVSRRFKKAQETDFFTIICWRGIAETCGRYLKKGSKVAIIGSIQNRNYEDANGVKRYTTEIIADEVQFLSNKSDDVADEDVKGEPVSELQPIDDSNGELPF